MGIDWTLNLYGKEKLWSNMTYDERRVWSLATRKRCPSYFTILIDSTTYAIYKDNGNPYSTMETPRWRWRPVAMNGDYDPTKAITIVDFLNKSDDYAGLKPKQIAKQLLQGLEDNNVKT